MRFAWSVSRPDDALNSMLLMRQFLGGPPEACAEAYDSASGQGLVQRGRTPPTLLVHGTIDTLVWVRHSRRLAARLTEATFADVVFFTNSGAEANECAIKMARSFHAAAGHPERYRVLAFKGSFHGRTLATLAAACNPKNLDGFGPVVDGFDHAPYGDLAAATAAVGPHTAAILVEPIQGEGGIRVPDPAFLKGLRALADKTGALLMFDEVQCGMGRTGALFAHQRVGVTPDVMTVAKGLAGGFPVGACIATRRAAAAMTAGSHASTFGGNPLAMRVALEVLAIVAAPAFLARVAQVGQVLAAGLDALVARHPHLYLERRGVGDVDTMTVREYLAASKWRRLGYRIYRHPLVIFGLGPTYIFLLRHRIPAGSIIKSREAWLSVLGTNLAMIAVGAAFAATLGLGTLLIGYLPVALIGASAGVWLFYVQHQYEETYWAHEGEWDFATAAWQGSSFYDLPAVLRWLTANIGFHHIHHLSPRIPNYNLERCHRSDPLFQSVKRVTFLASLRSGTLRLWDESAKKLVGFRRMREVRRERSRAREAVPAPRRGRG